MSVTAPRRPRPVTPIGILAAKLDAALDALSEVPDGMLTELRAARDLASGLDGYLDRCTTAESRALAELAERTVARDWNEHPGSGPAPLEQEMLSGHVEGQLLQMLVHATRATRVLEIGLFTGYSALAMAEALPPDGQVVACEIDADVAAFAADCLSVTPAGARVDIRVGPALGTLSQLAAARDAFDLIFVDADKPGYADYVDAILSGNLLTPHGLLCVDNTLMQGEPYCVVDGDARSRNGAAIAAFNDAVAADPRIAQVLLPLRDGITLIRRVDVAETG